MKLTHIVVGNEAAKPLQEAQQLDEKLQGNILILKDTLGIGQLHTSENESFELIRTNFWKSISTNWNENSIVDDETNILNLCNNINDGDVVWFWMAPCISDVMAYFWLLKYFKNHPGVLHCIFINSLPFFNAKGTLFYPKNFSEVLPTEIVKCQKLVKDVSLADYEIDEDEWMRLIGENAIIRSYEGGKKISSRNINYYDNTILQQFSFTNEYVKASKVIQQAFLKITDTVSDIFLIYRLFELIKENKLIAKGDIAKGLKDIEVVLNKENNVV